MNRQDDIQRSGLMRPLDGDIGFMAICFRSLRRMLRRPIYWVGIFFIPLFGFIFLTSLMEEGLPVGAPAAVIDNDNSELSRGIIRNLSAMQMTDIKSEAGSFSEARDMMQRGEIYGFFLIPSGFQADLLAGRKTSIDFYINMTYYVPGSLQLKTFKTVAVYSKAGIVTDAATQTGIIDAAAAKELLMPLNISLRPLENPQLNYAVYLCNSFLPGILQLLIMLVTVFTLGEEIKFGTSVQLMKMARGSVLRAVAADLLPQTIMWMIVAFFMSSWLYGYNHYPMNGSWSAVLLSEFLFVLASQGFAIFIFGVLPNMRLALSVCALTGILSFSIAAFSFPVESMYPAVGIFSWILPVRYNFLIYVDQILNGIPMYYSRIWYAAYIAFIIAPFTMLWRIKRAMLNPVYIP